MVPKNMLVIVSAIFAFSPLAVACSVASGPEPEETVATEQPLRNNGTDGTTMGDLQNKGYTCASSGDGFWVCTLDGEQTYWCDNYSCAPAPFRALPVFVLPATPGPALGSIVPNPLVSGIPLPPGPALIVPNPLVSGIPLPPGPALGSIVPIR
jgi:hypothetical protein